MLSDIFLGFYDIWGVMSIMLTLLRLLSRLFLVVNFLVLLALDIVQFFLKVSY